MADYNKSQLRILKAANEAFLAMKADNPDLWYDSSGGHPMTLRFSNGTELKNVRPDCSGMMRAIIMYMGYEVPGTWTGAWYGHTSNDIIKDKNGGYSDDWVVEAFDGHRQPGDILVTSGHTDMYVFTDSSGEYRGFNAGAGNKGSSISVYGMEYSVNLARHYQSTGEWTGGGPTDGGYTISENTGVTLIRYVGAGTDPASRGKLFHTTKDIYDVSGFQEAILDRFDPATTGGLIIQVCRIRSYGVGTETAGTDDTLMTRVFPEFFNQYNGVIPLGFYFYSYLPYETSEGNTKDAINKCFDFMEQVGVTPDNAALGVWIDLEDIGPTPSSSKTTNYKQVKWFQDIASQRHYRTAGLYSNASYITDHFNDSDLTNVPLWPAWWGQTVSGIQSWAANHGFTKVYLLQDAGDGSYQIAGHDVDHDVLVQDIPYGRNDYDYDEDGTSDTGSGMYQIVPAKKIIFNPTPGVIRRNTIVSVDTDAPNARVFVTYDNSVPDYSKPEQDWTGKRYLLARNYHLRAYAFDPQGTVVAKGAATYTVPWVRPVDEDLTDFLLDFNAHKELSVQPHLEYNPGEEEDDASE